MSFKYTQSAHYKLSKWDMHIMILIYILTPDSKPFFLADTNFITEIEISLLEQEWLWKAAITRKNISYLQRNRKM